MGRAELKPRLPCITDTGLLAAVHRLILQEGRALAEAFVAHTVRIAQLLCLSSHFRLGNKAHAQEEATLTGRPLMGLLFHVNSLMHNKV